MCNNIYNFKDIFKQDDDCIASTTYNHIWWLLCKGRQLVQEADSGVFPPPVHVYVWLQSNSQIFYHDTGNTVLCLPMPTEKILFKTALEINSLHPLFIYISVLCCLLSKLKIFNISFLHSLKALDVVIHFNFLLYLKCTDIHMSNTARYWPAVLGGFGRCSPPAPNQTAHPRAPSAAAAAVVPGPHGQKWTGPLLQDQNSGSGLTAGPLCQPHPHYSTDVGPIM